MQFLKPFPKFGRQYCVLTCPEYLIEALRAVPSEEVTLELTNGLSPIVLTPVDEKYDFAYMVLPVRIKG